MLVVVGGGGVVVVVVEGRGVVVVVVEGGSVVPGLGGAVEGVVVGPGVVVVVAYPAVAGTSVGVEGEGASDVVVSEDPASRAAIRASRLRTRSSRAMSVIAVAGTSRTTAARATRNETRGESAVHPVTRQKRTRSGGRRRWAPTCLRGVRVTFFRRMPPCRRSYERTGRTQPGSQGPSWWANPSTAPTRVGAPKGPHERSESACKPDSVCLRGGTATICLGPSSPTASCDPPGSIGRANRSLLGLAPDGVYRAGTVTRPAGGLLPHRFTLACSPPRGAPSAVCSLLHCPSAHAAWVLPSVLPCGVRTFLDAVTGWWGAAVAQRTR